MNDLKFLRTVCRYALIERLKDGHVYAPGVIDRAAKCARRQISQEAEMSVIMSTFFEMQIYDGQRGEVLVD